MIFGNVDSQDLERFRFKRCGNGKLCEFSKKPHIVLTGSDPTGIPWTRRAQAYPPRFAAALAKVLVAPARDKRSLF